MKIHHIAAEPANYTQDLMEQVYKNYEYTFSFLNSEAIATDDNSINSRAEHLFDRSSLFSTIKFLRKISKENDLVIFNGYTFLSFVILWYFSFFNKCFIAIESDTPYRKRNGVFGLLKFTYLHIIFSNPKILGLPGGGKIHQQLFSHYGMPEKRIFFLPMMINNNKYFRQIDIDSFTPPKILKFLYVGRLIPVKNVKLLVNAVICILKLGIKVELDIVGDGIGKEELLKLIENYPSIRLLGKKFGKEIVQSYHNANVMVLPSNFEPWGLVVNESLSAGIPVLCSSVVGSAPDLIIEPDAGWVFRNEDENDLVKVLLEIIDNPNQIIQKGKRGQDFVLNFWGYKTYIQCLNKVIAYVEKN